MTQIPSFAAELFLSAQLLLGHAPIDPPEIITLTHEALQIKACPADQVQRCQVRAWYSPDGIIYINEALDLERDLYSRSILVHEFVHHFQKTASGRAAESCEEWRDRERQAYEIQIKWLRANGWFRSLGGQFPFVRCG